MFRKNDFHNDYKRGMDMIYAASGPFGTLVEFLGFPIANESIPTAQVVWDDVNSRITFELNPHFINPLTDEQIGAVISHETYHVLLQHLNELMSGQYKRDDLLIEAHECIINDGLVSNIGLKLPEGVLYGIERHNQDFSFFSTQEGYDFLANKYEEKQDNSSNQDNSMKDNSSNGNNSPENSSNGNDSSEKNSEKGKDKSVNNNGTPNDAPGLGDSSGSCGGVKVKSDEVNSFNDYIAKAVEDALDKMNQDELTSDMKDLLEQFSDVGDGFSIGSNKNTALTPIVDINMNWFKLLESINPKINDSGAYKVKESWQRPPRRLVSVYPNVILPERTRIDPNSSSSDDNAIPTFILALDLSGSIPRSLVSKLVSLVDDVPEKVIKAVPVTWSDYVLPYDKNTKTLVACGGTNINAVYDYAEKYADENNGVRPYVLVITDGQCSFNGWVYGATVVDDSYIKEKWFWCAIRDRDEYTIESYFRQYLNDNSVYRLSDFTS